MTQRTITLLATAFAMTFATGCATRLQLKKPTRFTAKQIRTIHVTDACRLQAWFDTRPAPNKLITQVGTTYPGKDGFVHEHGTTSYRITDSRQQGMLMMLLARFYRVIPVIAMKSSFEVAVDFHRVAGKVRMRPGTPIWLEADGRTTRLAYHPCIAEYLLNRDLYSSRRRFVVSTVVPGSTD